MEKLDKSLSIKRKKLQQECDILRDLLKPWKIEIKPEALVVGPSEQCEDLPSPVETIVKEDEELKENLDKIDQILAKVHTIRSGVKDEEVRDACQMEKIKLNGNSRTLKKVSETLKNNQTEPLKHKLTVKSTQSKKMYNTTYKHSYQPPQAKSSGGVSKSATFGIKPPSGSRRVPQSSAIRNQKASHSTKLAPRNSVMNEKGKGVIEKGRGVVDVSNKETSSSKVVAISGKAGAEARDKATQDPPLVNLSKTEQPAFDLVKDGSNLKVSKNLCLFIKRSDLLQKLTSGLELTNRSQLPSALELYYSELETTSPYG